LEKIDRDGFLSAWKKQGEVLSSWKRDKGKGIMGLVLTDVPEELVYAAGAVPTSLLAEDVAFQEADKHLQGFACSYSRSVVERAEQNELDFLDGIIIPYACDTTRCLDLIFKYMERFKFYDCLRLPKRVNARGVEKYFRAELLRLASAISGFTGEKVTDENLSESIKLYNRVRSSLEKLREKIRQDGGGPALYLDAVKSAMVLPPEISEEALSSLVKEEGKGEAVNGPRVLVAGKMAEPPGVVDLLTDSGLSIIEDHLTVGGRWVASTVPEGEDPWQALIERQMERMPFSGIWDNRPSRASYLIERVRELKADGVVFLVQKFCEPAEIDYPGVRRELDALNIPVLELETDLRQSGLETVRTRIDAFAEMIK
jgi:benzoyl-CoA reductase/2-hydroxyglutaryl-CoA dehydratase subunit BcrC/BadD/HgdB